MDSFVALLMDKIVLIVFCNVNLKFVNVFTFTVCNLKSINTHKYIQDFVREGEDSGLFITLVPKDL